MLDTFHTFNMLQTLGTLHTLKTSYISTSRDENERAEQPDEVGVLIHLTEGVKAAAILRNQLRMKATTHKTKFEISKWR